MRCALERLVDRWVVLGAAGLAIGALAPLDVGGGGASVLIEDAHSDQWAPSARALSFDWYGDFSTYNLSSFAEYLSYEHRVTIQVDGQLDAECLAKYDTLILKTPVLPYTPAEVDAVLGFVERGGGLFLVGDHTDLLGTSSHLNQIGARVGLQFRSDYTRDGAGGFSVVDTPWHEIVPLARDVGRFEFMTGCSLLCGPSATPLMVGRKQEVVNHDYSDNNQFGSLHSDPSQPHGDVVLAAAVQHGAGRVVAFTDSTVMSGFAICRDERMEFFAACVRWLRGRSLPRWPAVAVAVALAMLCVRRAWLRRAGRPVPWTGSVVFGFGLGHLVVVALAAASSWRLPSTGGPCDRPTLAVVQSGCRAWYPPVLGFGGDYEKWEYDTLFAAWLRGGVFPKQSPDFEDALQHRAMLVLNPMEVLTSEQRRRLAQWVSNGGRLVVACRTDYFEWAPFESLVGQFAPRLAASLSREQSLEQLHLLDAVELGCSNQRMYVGRIDHGAGAVFVVVGSEWWNTAKLGHCFHVPHREQREAYEVVAALCTALLGEQIRRDRVEVRGDPGARPQAVRMESGAVASAR